MSLDFLCMHDFNVRSRGEIILVLLLRSETRKQIKTDPPNDSYVWCAFQRPLRRTQHEHPVLLAQKYNTRQTVLIVCYAICITMWPAIRWCPKLWKKYYIHIIIIAFDFLFMLDAHSRVREMGRRTDIPWAFNRLSSATPTQIQHGAQSTFSGTLEWLQLEDLHSFLLFDVRRQIQRIKKTIETFYACKSVNDM